MDSICVRGYYYYHWRWFKLNHLHSSYSTYGSLSVCIVKIALLHSTILIIRYVNRSRGIKTTQKKKTKTKNQKIRNNKNKVKTQFNDFYLTSLLNVMVSNCHNRLIKVCRLHPDKI